MATIPSSASRDIQSTIQQLNEEIARLQKRITLLERDETGAQRIVELQQELDRKTRKPTFQDPNDAFRGGNANAVGLVPDPGTGERPAGLHRFLREDAAWRVPGIIGPFAVEADDPHGKFNIPGHLGIQGGLNVGGPTVIGGDVHVLGSLDSIGGPGKIITHGILLVNTVTYLSADQYDTLEIQVTGTITAGYARGKAGTSVTGNVVVGGSDICSSNFTIASDAAWATISANQNLSVSPGDDLRFDIDSVSGNVTDFACYIIIDVDS